MEGHSLSPSPPPPVRGQGGGRPLPPTSGILAVTSGMVRSWYRTQNWERGFYEIFMLYKDTKILLFLSSKNKHFQIGSKVNVCVYSEASLIRTPWLYQQENLKKKDRAGLWPLNFCRWNWISILSKQWENWYIFWRMKRNSLCLLKCRGLAVISGS